MKITHLSINGEVDALASVNPGSKLKPEVTYRLSAGNRDKKDKISVDISQDKYFVEFTFDDDTTWMCDAATLHEVFPEAEEALRSDSTEFELPATIKNTDSDRGIVGDIVLKALGVFEKKIINSKVADIARKLENQHFINGIYNKLEDADDGFKNIYLEEGAGLFRITKEFKFKDFEEKNSGKPYLLFIHGTNSDTKGAFSSLAQAETWNFIHNTYGENVLAFQHRTLTQSPLQNAVKLAHLLPNNAVVHIISHSRGGLVGDILCKYTAVDGVKKNGFSNAHIDLLKKEGNRDNDIECIKELNTIFLNKKIEVKKFIRVACPAAGTILASKRLEHIFNTFFNLLRFADVSHVLTDTLKELIAQIIKTKDDINVLPGVEAQSPYSPFIKILNDNGAETGIDGSSLAVISGNGKASVSLKGLLVILGKFFYWQRNDLVVNTDSMYLGVRRTGNIQYFFDQGAEVDHVKYFLHNKTREAILFALKTPAGELIPGFNSVPQLEIPGSDRGFEHGELFPVAGIPSGKKPIVVLLPGIMGSNLSREGDKLWLAYLHTALGGLIDMEQVDDKTIIATSIIKTSYKQLRDKLSYAYDVVVYPFDWRKQLNDCAKEFNDKITELLKLNQPIKIIGHSMGGVLVRDFIINYDSTWNRLNASKGFRLLFLGSPLGGSHRILTVLFGNDAIINSLSMLDMKHTKKELLKMFSNFPGILSLLPLSTDAENDFADEATWIKMRDAFGDNTWPIPSAKQLATFKNYRDAILNKRDEIDYSNMCYIAGQDKFTPCGYYNDEIPPRRELVFLVTGEGDQSVTWESGIPRQIADAQRVYYVPVSHGALANDASIFNGIEEILEKGSTGLLNKTRPLIRGNEKKFRMPETYNFDLSERGIENSILGIATKIEINSSQVPVSVSVCNGDLAYASFPLLAGHFINDGILYAEKSIDKNLNNILSARHQLDLYPGEIGTSAVISTNTGEDKFPGAIIVGLGEPGTLTGFLLSKTIEQGVSKYLLHINNGKINQDRVGISTLVIGCGYGGLSIETSIKAIIEGINNANAKITGIFKSSSKIIQYVEIIELYEDKALSSMYALSKIENIENRIYNIRVGNKKIRNLFGARKRMPLITADEWWNRFTVRSRKPAADSKEVPSIVFGVSAGAAREEERELFSSTQLIDIFIEEASTQNNWSPELAKTIFELMIPNDFKDRLKKKGSIVWILDKDTAAYPWELLQHNTVNTKPLCVDAGMIRQLSTKNFRVNINRVAGDRALIVADPLLKGFINQLPGAANEGKVVQAAMDSHGYNCTSLINKNAPEIVKTLFGYDYRIIHLAGHGVFNANAPRKSGMVIGNDIFLTTFDIEQMSMVPELVFVNCCHLGKTSAKDELYYQDRFRLAANIGTQLIEIGVKAVIAAGWAVNDAAAADFAAEFYKKIFAGYNFGDAVKEARSYVYSKYGMSNNTWGAYQCYGDPFYKLVNRWSAQQSSRLFYVIAEEAEIDLHNLKNSLDTRNITVEEAEEQLNSIAAAIEKAELDSCEITELKAVIYTELGDYQKAIEEFKNLKVKEKAAYSVQSLEKYCNVRSKKIASAILDGNRESGVKEIDVIITELNELLKIGETTERYNLLGSAYKRKALAARTKKTKKETYEAAIKHYAMGYDKTGDSYSLNNLVVLHGILSISNGVAFADIVFEGKVKKSAKEMIEELTKRKQVLQQTHRNMDYWDIVDDAGFDLSLLILNNEEAKKAENWKNLEDKYIRVWGRAGSKGKKNDEVQNFKILSDMLGMFDTEELLFLKDKIDKLKEKLDKVISEK